MHIFVKLKNLLLDLGFFSRKLFLNILSKWKPIIRFLILLAVACWLSHLLFPSTFSYLNEKVEKQFHSFEGCYSSIGMMIPTTIQASFPSVEINGPENLILNLLDKQATNYLFEDIINTPFLLNYGIFVKNTTDITDWRVLATEPKEKIVPVVLVANINGKDFNLSYQQEEIITTKLFGYKNLLGKHQIDMGEIAFEPKDKESIKGLLLGPNETLKIENLSHENKPISLDDATERSGNKCLFVSYIRPVDLAWWVKVIISFVVFVFVSFLIIKIIVGFLRIYNFIFHGKIKS